MIEQLLDELLVREGGYVNHPDDKGGATNWGITIATLANYRGRSVSVADVNALTQSEARAIYKDLYYLQPKIDQLPEPFQPVVFDTCVNCGRLAAGKLFQQALGDAGFACKVDGLIGAGTISMAIAAVKSRNDTAAVINAYCDRRCKHYQAICQRNANQRVFLNGWLKRAESFRV
jgi:lysozyme family protein